ncbi:hypothetical protein J6590_047449 [Homalodisca vitripennis]|nr:hypothetical protein J6590_047449 [Homalodisca vitripennis]
MVGLICVLMLSTGQAQQDQRQPPESSTSDVPTNDTEPSDMTLSSENYTLSTTTPPTA